MLRRLLDDKQIVNPMNPEEVFTCKDLVDGNRLLITIINQFRLQGVQKREETADAEGLQNETLL